MFLMFTPMLGLREVNGYPRKIYQGTFVRGLNPGNTWSVSVLRKNVFGRNVEIHWVDVPPEKLPARLKTEALLMGVTC